MTITNYNDIKSDGSSEEEGRHYSSDEGDPMDLLMQNVEDRRGNFECSPGQILY